jgi:hypothetical protein
MLSSFEVLALKLCREGEDKTKQEHKIFDVLSWDEKLFTRSCSQACRRAPFRLQDDHLGGQDDDLPLDVVCQARTSQIIVSLDLLDQKYFLTCSV